MSAKRENCAGWFG